MGKRMIIKEADYSHNALTPSNLAWHIGLRESVLSAVSVVRSTNNYYLVASELAIFDLIGKTANYVKVYAQKNGTVTIGTCNPNDGIVISFNTYNVIAGLNIIKLAAEITFSAGVTAFVAGKNVLTYWASSLSYGSDHGWLNQNGSRMPIDFGNESQ